MSHNAAILLCAGYGTRMGALAATTPKPLLPVAGKPVIDYLLDQVEGFQPRVDGVHIVTNARFFGVFEEWAGRQQRPFSITVYNDGSTSNEDRRGAAGDLGFVLAEIERTSVLPERALIAAGDNVLRFSLQGLWGALGSNDEAHRILALREMRPERLRKSGVLELGEDDGVLRLHEKPEEPVSHWLCPPFYALRRSALERVPDYLETSPNTDEIGRLIGHLATQEPFFALRTEGQRLDIGSPESYRQACQILEQESVFHPGDPMSDAPYPPPDSPYPFISFQPKTYAPEEVERRGQDFYELMDARRSIREFSDRPVARELIETAIRTASTAPSGAHRQPWRFVAISDPAIKHQIRVAAEEEEKKTYEQRMPDEWREALAPLGTTWQKPFLEVVPWIVVVFEELFGYYDDGSKKKNYYVGESTGLACGLFIASLHNMGLATLTHTPSPMGFLRDILGRPKNEKPFILFPVGYPADNVQVPDLSRKSLEEVAIWNPKPSS